jgi:hypothetical protein
MSEGVTDTAVAFVDLYKCRDDLKRELAGVEQAIERCSCSSSWANVPPSAFEDRGGDRWVRVSYRTCTKCGLVCERVDENPREGLGHWQRTAKLRKVEA